MPLFTRYGYGANYLGKRAKILSPGLDASMQNLDVTSTRPRCAPRCGLDARLDAASMPSLDSLDAASMLQGPSVVTLCATSVKAASKMPRCLDAGLDDL